MDNAFIERLWCTVKYEDIFLREYATVPALVNGLQRYLGFYSTERPQRSLGYRTAAEADVDAQGASW